MSNPLSSYFRHPELYIQLPSDGKWWTPGALAVTENKEYPIYPLTGKDELSMKNADGLMNGDTTVAVIQSCCPAIRDAWQMPSIDIDTVMIAMRIASYGYKMETETKCAKCNETNAYAVDLRVILSGIKFPDYSVPIEVKDLYVFARPAPYRIINLNNMETYQQQRAIMQIKNQNLTEEEKVQIVKDAIQRLTDISVLRLGEFIDRIMLPDGTSVFDKEYITQFINNTDRETFNILKDALTKKAEEYKLPSIPTKCDHCGHEDERQFQFDPASFFVTSS